MVVNRDEHTIFEVIAYQETVEFFGYLKNNKTQLKKMFEDFLL